MVANKVADAKGAALSIAKAIPVLAGALAGFFLPPENGWSSVYENIKRGNGQETLNSAVASYTFYNYQKGGFSMSAGTGVKTLLFGGFASKLIDWLL